MDINVDQGLPRIHNDIVTSEEGKSIYIDSTGKFDVDKFNRDFQQYKERRQTEMDIQLKQKADELTKKANISIPIYNLGIGETLIKFKDSFFGILDDLLRFDLSMNTFTKENRLFYIGLFLIVVAIFCIIIYVLLSTDWGVCNEACYKQGANP